MADIAFTFDPAPFVSSINKMTSSMETFSGNSSKMMGRMAMSTVGIIKNIAGVGAAYLGLKGIMGGIPEIGMAFNKIGDIMQRNFLWPLRQELAPHLQGMLNWARDNRAQFVKWGTVLVNVFRGVVQVVKGLIDAMKPIFEAFAGMFRDMFGGVSRTISDTINIIIFRITAVAIFIVETFRPVFQAIGQMLTYAYGLVASFFRGFIDGVSPVLPALGLLWDTLQELWETLGFGNTQIQGLGEIFGFFGDLLGTTIVLAVQGVTIVIDILVTTLYTLYLTIKAVFQLMTGNIEGATQSASQIGDAWVGNFRRMERQASLTENILTGFGTRTANRFRSVTGGGSSATGGAEAGRTGVTGATPAIRPQQNITNRQSNVQANNNNRISQNINVVALNAEEGTSVGTAVGNATARGFLSSLRTAIDRQLAEDAVATGAQ